MLTGALEMKETTVRRSGPRVDMVVLEENKTLQDAIKTIQEEGFSRFPVFRDNVDNIIGVVYAKDILNASRERI